MHDPNKGTRARRPGTSSKALSVIQNSLPSPCKGLHTSRPAAHPGMVLRFALPLPAKTGDRSALSPPQNGREVAVGSGILRPLHPELPPQFPKNRSVKCAAFNADLVAAPAPCRSGCRGEAPCPSETPPPGNCCGTPTPRSRKSRFSSVTATNFISPTNSPGWPECPPAQFRRSARHELP